MIRFSDDFLYSKHHLWILPEEGSPALIGITQVMTMISGDPDEVEFMAVEGEEVEPGRILARLLTEDDEWEIPAPFKGTIVNFNLEVADHPESVVEDPYDEGWLVRLEPADPSALDHLLEAGDYEDHVIDQLAEDDDTLWEDGDEFEQDDGLDENERYLDEDEDEDEGPDDDY